MTRDFLPLGLSKFIGSDDAAVTPGDSGGPSSADIAAMNLPVRIMQAISTTAAPVHILEQGADARVFFPQELIGGVCPLIAGEEEYTVWRAAATACGTERVHIAWNIVHDKIFYLAIKSEEIASHHNTWCPFAALLPGMKDSTASPVCYTYYAHGSAAMMLVTADDLQIYRGISLIARAKAERASRELGNAPIIELTPDRVAQLTPSAWQSTSLFEDRARRILTMVSMLSAVALATLAFAIWLYASISFVGSRVTLANRASHQEKDVSQFAETFQHTRGNPMHKPLAEFIQVNDELLGLDGLLTTYQIRNDDVYWRAVVTPSISPENLKDLHAILIDAADGKTIIGRGSDAEGGK